MQWRQYWHTEQRVLLEKSPRHALMTRLLQYYYGAERTSFLVLLRHPLATMRAIWGVARPRGMTSLMPHRRPQAVGI